MLSTVARRTDMTEQKDLHIENTSELLTSSVKGKGTKRTVLIIVAAAAILLIAIIGCMIIGNKKYNDQIAIADKAFVEGDYEQAETEYLTAVNMNRRKVKGREGLAYTYAVLEKYDDSSSEYEALYKDTGDERYRIASEETGDGNLPSDNSLIPAGDPGEKRGSGDNGVWETADVSELTGTDDLRHMLTEYYSSATFYYFYGESGDRVRNNTFDSDTIGQSYALLAAADILRNGHSDSVQTVSDNDPRGWFTAGYYRIPRQLLEDTFCRTFNADKTKLSEAETFTEGTGWMYIEGDSFCLKMMGKDWLALDSRIRRVWKNGSRFCVEYDIVELPNSYYNDSNEEVRHDSFYAIVEPVKEGKQQVWTVHSISAELPPEVAQKQAET